MPYDYSSSDYNAVDRTHTDKNWNLTVSDKKNNAELDSSDFLNLMIAQLKNQDFMSPMDNTEYVTQMAQFNSMQVMSELASYSKTSYAMSLVGKDVTASKFQFSGDLDTETGAVQKVSLVNNEYVIYVNGKKYSLDQVMEVQRVRADDECIVDPSDTRVTYSDLTDTSVKVKWTLPTEDTSVAKSLKYRVYYTGDTTETKFDTVKEVEEKGKKVGVDLKELTDGSKLVHDIKDLEPGTNYYINILVEDSDGNKTVYKPAMISTKSS